MSDATLVPIKRLAAGKSRLEGVLGRAALEKLVLAMLDDLVAALRAVPECGRVIVVTPDDAVAREAEGAGAEGWVRRDPGLNASLDGAGSELLAAGCTRLLVVLGDVAGALPEEIARLYRALEGLGGRGAVLAPARDGGTAALLRAPPDAIANHFGKESAAAHRALAREAALPFAELPLPSLAIDLDRIEDARALATGPGAPATRALLAELGIGGA